MNVKPRIKNAIFLAWLLFVPAGTWYIYKAYPPNFIGHWLDI
ncbi:hypothetical protein QF028_000740 [Neobacillus sp. B4I6]